MTIITAVQKNGEVAIACDTQSTSYNNTLKHTADYKTNHSKLTCSKFWAIGSGQDFALGALEILYEQDLTASEIAETAAFIATQFNPGCAPPIYVETLPMRRSSKTKSKKKKRTARKKQK